MLTFCLGTKHVFRFHGDTPWDRPPSGAVCVCGEYVATYQGGKLVLVPVESTTVDRRP